MLLLLLQFTPEGLVVEMFFFLFKHGLVLCKDVSGVSHVLTIFDTNMIDRQQTEVKRNI